MAVGPGTESRDESAPLQAHPSAVGGRHVATAASVLAIAGAFALVPTPLWPIYIDEAGYNHVDTTFAFAVYAVGVLGALVLAGDLSERAGRRPVLVAAIGFELFAATLMWLSPSLPAVTVARLLTGVGIGLVTAAGTGAIGDLARAVGGRMHHAVATTVTLATLGGFAIGSLSSGLIARAGPEPLETPYAVYAGLLVAALMLVHTFPETRHRSGAVQLVRLLRPPPTPNRYYVAAAVSVAAVNVAFGSFTVTAPSLVVEARGTASTVWSGAVVAAMFVGSASCQALIGRMPAPRQLLLGATMFVAGLAGFSAAALNPSVAVLFASALVLGGGAGVLFRSAVALAVAADDRHRSRAVATLYVAFYLGLSLPVLGLGALMDHVGEGFGVSLVCSSVSSVAVTCVLVLRRV